jgi:hypothetical protein
MCGFDRVRGVRKAALVEYDNLTVEDDVAPNVGRRLRCKFNAPTRLPLTTARLPARLKPEAMLEGRDRDVRARAIDQSSRTQTINESVLRHCYG